MIELYNTKTQEKIDIGTENVSGSIFSRGETLLISANPSLEGYKEDNVIEKNYTNLLDRNWNIIEKKYTKILDRNWVGHHWLDPSGSPFGYYYDNDNLYVHNVTTEESWRIPDCRNPIEIYTVNNEPILWYAGINNQKKLYNLTKKEAIIIEGENEYSRVHEDLILEYKDSEDKTHLYNLETKEDVEIPGKLYKNKTPGIMSSKYCFRAGKEYFAQYSKTDETGKRSLQIFNLTTKKPVILKEGTEIERVIFPRLGGPSFNEFFLVCQDTNKQQILYNATTKQEEEVTIEESDVITHIFETGAESFVLFKNRQNRNKQKLYNLTTKQYLDISPLYNNGRIKKILKVDNEIFAIAIQVGVYFGKSSYLYNITKKSKLDTKDYFINNQNFHIATRIRHHKKYPKLPLVDVNLLDDNFDSFSNRINPDYIDNYRSNMFNITAYPMLHKALLDEPDNASLIHYICAYLNSDQLAIINKLHPNIFALFKKNFSLQDIKDRSLATELSQNLKGETKKLKIEQVKSLSRQNFIAN